MFIQLVRNVISKRGPLFSGFLHVADVTLASISKVLHYFFILPSFFFFFTIARVLDLDTVLKIILNEIN